MRRHHKRTVTQTDELSADDRARALIQEPVEGGAGDPEVFGGLCLVAAGLLQRLHHGGSGQLLASLGLLLTELDQVVDRLERGDLPLEEALERFERGVNLSREAERILGQAERRVEVLLSTKEGDVLAPLDGASDPRKPDGP